MFFKLIHSLIFAAHLEKPADMGVTRLKRKARRNKQTSAKRNNSIKQLSYQPVIKQVDKEELKASFAVQETPKKAKAKKEEAPKVEEVAAEAPKAEAVVEAPVEEVKEAEPKAEKKEAKPKAEKKAAKPKAKKEEAKEEKKEEE